MQKWFMMFKNWKFNEQNFRALGAKKYGLLKQIVYLLILGIPILLIIASINLVSFFYPLFVSITIPSFCLLFFIFAVYSIKTKCHKKQNNLWMKAKFFLSLLYLIWISVFCFGLICWFGTAFLNFTMPSKNIRFPFSDLEEIALGYDNNIYCVSGFYNRLQVFNSKGDFIKGWFVNLPAGKYSISVDKEANVFLSMKNNKVYIYDCEGKRLKRDDIKIHSLKQENRIDDNGDNYIIRQPYFYPHIIKRSTNGVESKIIQQPFGMWLITMPIPSLLFVVILFVLERCFAKKIVMNKDIQKE